MRFVIFLWVSFFSLPSFSALDHITEAELALMHSLYQAQDRQISKTNLKARLLENQFLLSHARKLNLSLLDRHAPVGFDNAYHVRRYIRSMLLHKFPQLTHTSQKPLPVSLSGEELKSLLGPYPNNGQYTEQQRQKWRQVSLSKQPKLTLDDILASQSMQGRFSLHEGDTRQLNKDVEDFVSFHQLKNKAAPLLAKQKLSLTRLNLLALGELLRPSIQAYLGVKSQLHGERSDYVDNIRSHVSDQEIAQFYATHKNEFKYLQHISAFAAIFENQKDAIAIYDNANKNKIQQMFLKRGLRNHFSTSDNTQQLVQISRHHPEKWLAQVAFNNQLEELSRPIRTPQGQWVLIYTDKPSYAYHAKNSETVRYRALQHITRRKAKTAYAHLFNQWLLSANTKT
ncbi:peptidylprolyl isomerase [Pseudoalteromonas obscura]|uniref:Peptidylprolyl isomerase n=1 Tax=Pseudoalteromonas obscura TaxID=3048491 RepID=A0ABT7EMS3_9GAMM|nr:peptidylprolyl isomerase [Pseudoalteromonas sp. P94(2023)]MDK2596300.1 peptidylprolyl isomerase [Pseudoalteromonas sp. P94(2023)]